MSEWFEIIPQDTLFFRGNRPMEAGQLTAEPLFPPPLSVLYGALRTAVLREQNIDFVSYREGKHPEIEGLIGKSTDTELPFSIDGFFIKKREQFYMPCPASWFAVPKKNVVTGSDLAQAILITAHRNAEGISEMGIQSSSENIAYVSLPENAISLNGMWVSVNYVQENRTEIKADDFLIISDIYQREHRIGIGIDSERNVEQGKIYSSVHLRLLPDVSFVLELNKNPGLNSDGSLFFGGESRISYYKKINNGFDRNNRTADEWCSTVPIEANEMMLSQIIASGKIQSLSGWDMAKGFHKDSQNWIPAGAVFTEKILESCIPLIHK